MKKINNFLIQKITYILSGIALIFILSSFSTLVPPPPERATIITKRKAGPIGAQQQVVTEVLYQSTNIGCVSASNPFLFTFENNSQTSVTNVIITVNQTIRINGVPSTVTVASYQASRFDANDDHLMAITPVVPSGYAGIADFDVNIQYNESSTLDLPALNVNIRYGAMINCTVPSNPTEAY